MPGAEIHTLLWLDVPTDKTPDSFTAADRLVANHRLRVVLRVNFEQLWVKLGGERRARTFQEGGASRNRGLRSIRLCAADQREYYGERQNRTRTSRRYYHFVHAHDGL